MKRVYGMPLFRIPLDLGLGCPNRNSDGTGGCAFCPEDGARAQQTLNANNLRQQVDDAVGFARRRYGAKAFMAYIQAFTGTFAEASEQRRIYSEALSMFDHKAISIGTRPDCLDSSTMTFLKELSQNEEVWVELGVQTTNDAVLQAINRGHTWRESHDAILKLHENGIKVAVHLILGLPGETMQDYIKTAERLSALPVDGIKLHNLHIIKGTALAEQYAEKPFKVLNEFEYAEAAMEVIRRLPADIPVMRVCTDTADEQLIAPHWAMQKGTFTDYLETQMIMLGYYQGELLGADNPYSKDELAQKVFRTDDGSITFWSDDFKEHYHSKNGALLETMGKFITPSGLSSRLNSGNVRLLDICFGLGYNSLAAMNIALSLKRFHLDIYALEIDKRVVGNSAETMDKVFDHIDERSVLKNIYESSRFENDYISFNILWGDARHSITKVKGKFDLIFLDAFSSQRNAQLWTVDFFKVLAGLLDEKGLLLTYSTALPILSGLIKAGFCLGKSSSGEKMRSGTVASLSPELIHMPLDDDVLARIENTTKGIPYRDPTLSATNREILKMREQERIAENNQFSNI